MKNETALKRIKSAVNKTFKDERDEVKEYIIEVIYNFYISLEYDADAYKYTSTQNLKFTLAVNLEDEKDDILEDARKHASAWKNKKGA